MTRMNGAPAKLARDKLASPDSMVWHCSSSEKRWQARECKPLIGLGFGMDQKLPGGDEHADMPAILGLGYQGYPVRYIVL